MKIRKFFSEAYNKINIIFTGIILLVFIYSGIFSSNGIKHPIKSVYAQKYYKPIVSTGLSRSFSEIIRLNFNKAREFNRNGILVFFFFFIQFFLRIIFSFLYSKTIFSEKTVILTDGLISAFLFFFTFRNLIFSVVNRLI